MEALSCPLTYVLSEAINGSNAGFSTPHGSNQLYVQHRHFRFALTQVYSKRGTQLNCVYSICWAAIRYIVAKRGCRGCHGEIPCYQWQPNDELPNPLNALEIRSNLQP